MVKKPVKKSPELAEAVIKGIQEVKGKEILSIDLRKIPNAVSDFFIICHGTSETHVDAIARSVEKTVFQSAQEDPMHKEGGDHSEWILLDYFNVVVHIFREETRRFYNLEKLWADADVKEIEYQL
jgi:ribosome-associated protein